MQSEILTQYQVYLEDGRIEISNNRAENAIRPFCVGRRNWLFTNTVQGAQTSAALYSLIETAKLNNLNPYEYFNYLLSSLTEIDINDEEALDNYMPWSKELPDNTYLTKKSQRYDLLVVSCKSYIYKLSIYYSSNYNQCR